MLLTLGVHGDSCWSCIINSFKSIEVQTPKYYQLLTCGDGVNENKLSGEETTREHVLTRLWSMYCSYLKTALIGFQFIKISLVAL